MPQACRIEPDREAAEATGPAYVVVSGVGIVRIDDSRGAVVVPTKHGRHWYGDFVVGPGRSVWMAGFGDDDLLRLGDSADGALPIGLATHPDERIEKVAARSPTDIWFATSSIEWRIGHYDGKRVTYERVRSDFPGYYDDNKLSDVAVTDDAFWVSSWNGLWKRDASGWVQVAAPPDAFRPGVDRGQKKHPLTSDLFVTERGLVVEFEGGYFLRLGEGWERLPLSSETRRVRGLNRQGVAASMTDRDEIFLQRMDDDACVVRLDSIASSRITDIAVDEAARVWVAGDHGLAVLDSAGKLIASWTPGELEGLDGEVRDVAVVGAGPRSLPPKQTPRRRTITGRVEIYKSSRPLGGVGVVLCSVGAQERRCEGAPFSRRARTGDDGSFELTKVPPGDFVLLVDVADDQVGCEGPFQPTSHFVSTTSDCGAHGATCDLGVLSECPPFEMPPPPP